MGKTRQKKTQAIIQCFTLSSDKPFNVCFAFDFCHFFACTLFPMRVQSRDWIIYRRRRQFQQYTRAHLSHNATAEYRLWQAADVESSQRIFTRSHLIRCSSIVVMLPGVLNQSSEHVESVWIYNLPEKADVLLKFQANVRSLLSCGVAVNDVQSVGRGGF